MEREDFETFVQDLVAELNTHVFGPIFDHLQLDSSLREGLNPAFPFPNTIRVGLLDECLVVEYVGPEVKDSDSFDIEGVYEPSMSVLDFLGIDLQHLSVPVLYAPNQVMNVSSFLGGAIDHLCDYFYDFTQVPSEAMMLNGFPEFSKPIEHTVVSNFNCFWTDQDGALKIKHVDFLEIFPLKNGDVYYHSKESYGAFARAILGTHVPKYRVKLHEALNRLIELINLPDTHEPMITKFIESTPELLQISLGANDLNPQVKLEWQFETEDDDLIPDFLIERMDGYCDILDFKLPSLKSSPTVGTSSRRHPSFEIDTAIAQLQKYEEWCSQAVNQKWLEKNNGIKLMHPQKYLIIGRSGDFSAADRQRLRQTRSTMVLTYDEFIEMARFQIYRVR